MQALQTSENGRFFVSEDGAPFFWLGDTAWELFHCLDRDEAQLYLENRAALGFNVIQAVALAERDGIRTGNAYGRRPLRKNAQGAYDPALPDVSAASDEYDYWDHVDYIVDTAASLGLYVALLPTWGDKFNMTRGKGPKIFDGENAQVFGSWIGSRYADRTHIIWVLGGDRHLDTAEHFAVVNHMAAGIRDATGGRHLMTFHPSSKRSSSFHLPAEPWLDFDMIQSGHGELHRPNYPLVAKDYEQEPMRPTLDAEPRYEDHPVGFRAENGYFDPADVREAAYWSVFAGGAGVTYGHHSIWSMTTEPSDYFIMSWQDALTRPAAAQLQHLKSLVTARPYLDRVPDQSLLADNYPGANHMQATRGKDYAFIYSPCGLPFDVRLGRLSGDQLTAQWYDPRSGRYQSIGAVENRGVTRFTPPSSGRCDDWVLVLDDADRHDALP